MSSKGFNDDLEVLRVGFGGVYILAMGCLMGLGVVGVVSKVTTSGQSWVGSANKRC